MVPRYVNNNSRKGHSRVLLINKWHFWDTLQKWMTSTVCTRFGPTLKVGLGLASRCFETQLSYAIPWLWCVRIFWQTAPKESKRIWWACCLSSDLTRLAGRYAHIMMGFFGRKSDFSHRWPYKIEEDVAGALGQLRFDVISKQYNKRTALLQALRANPTTYD